MNIQLISSLKSKPLLWVLCLSLIACGGGGGGGTPPPDDGGGVPGAPSKPANLVVSVVSAGQLNLVWDASTDDKGVTAYKVYRGNSFLADAVTTSFPDSGLTPATQYCYQVSAMDADSNESAKSDQQCQTTAAAGGDSQAPSVPTGVSATAVSSSQINLSWNASTDNVAVTGYHIYRGSGNLWPYLKSVNSTSTSDSGLPVSTTFCYRIAAVDGAGNVSGMSTQSCDTTDAGQSQTYTFNGGSIADLRAVSPGLQFGTLNINGTLLIPASESTVTLTVDNLNINGKIDVDQPTCSPFYNSPNLVINATGTVNVDSPVEVNGKSGTAIASGATCNSCYGRDGGDVSITAAEINVNRYIHTWGGAGRTESDIIGGQLIRYGCSAGDGGNITLNASNALNIGSLADFDLDGGSGGTGTYSSGADGTDGILNWYPSDINVSELVEGGSELNMYIYNAQLMDFETMSVRGNVYLNEEASHRGNSGSIYITFSGTTFIDYIEDFFLVDVKAYGDISLSLTPDNASADLDLYVLNSNATSIISQSNGGSTSESLTTPILPPGKYLIGVSYSDDGLNLSTGYTLQVTK